ncbi:hypothetical protein H4R35_002872 [Dimargaris xerosporica]|nr:hypothetical protein H4R35_002872 [Dimargaris xerosporica]
MAQTMADWHRQLLASHAFTSNGQVDPDMATQVKDLLARNHQEGIIFQGYRPNHTAHHLLVLKVLGGTIASLDDAFAYHNRRIEPTPPSVATITTENWEEYLSNHQAYADYVNVFDGQVAKLGLDATFAKYFPRLIPGLACAMGHSLIHTGFAVEFRHPHVLVEALAYASTWYDDWGNFLDAPASNSTVGSFQHPLEIFTALQQDPELTTDFMADVNLHHRLRNMAQSLENTKAKALVNAWKIGDTEQARLDSIRQLMRTVTLEFAGRHEDPPFNFFCAHLVTSMFATQSLVPLLQPKDQDRLLRIQLYFAIVVYFVQGCVPFSQSKVDSYILPERFQGLSPETMDHAIHQEAAGHSDLHAIKVARTMQVLTLLDPEFHDTYTNVAAMVLDRVHKKKDWSYPRQE